MCAVFVAGLTPKGAPGCPPVRGLRQQVPARGPGDGAWLESVVGEVPLDRLWHAVPAYPTMSEVWLRLLEAYGL